MTVVLPTYCEAPAADLLMVGWSRDFKREIKLRTDAATALLDLLKQAHSAGIALVPISGFRTVEYQAALFERAVIKHGSESAAGRWVARPGYSEHHTGLAVDLGDEADPASDVEPAFEITRAFAWLQHEAVNFGFELSYPENNAAGINFEPWHWRFVGTPCARQIFTS